MSSSNTVSAANTNSSSDSDTEDNGASDYAPDKYSTMQSQRKTITDGVQNYGFQYDDGNPILLDTRYLGDFKKNGGPVMDEDSSALIFDAHVVERPIYNQVEFDLVHEPGAIPRPTPRSWMRKKSEKWQCSGKCVGKAILGKFPFIPIMKKYKIRRDLPSDIIAGLTVGIMHIPQGMAYGLLTNLPPVYGLYVSFFPVLLYFFFGTSKHMSIGTFAVVSLMIGSVVDKGMLSHGIVIRDKGDVSTANDTNITSSKVYDRNDPYVVSIQLGYAMAVTFAVGCLQLLMGFFRLGFVSVYLSDPLVAGFTTGAACHVFTSQIKHVFGLDMGKYSGPLRLIYSYIKFFTNIPTTNYVTLITSVTSIVIIIAVKEGINNNPKLKGKLKMPVPIDLILVVVATIVSHFMKLNSNYEVSIVGEISVGMPSPNISQFKYLSEVITDAFAIGIVAFAISVSMAKILATKHDYAIDPNQELFAYGTINVFGSFFSTFCSSASLSRSLVQDGVGCKTQVSGIVSSCLILLVLLVVGPYFEDLPSCILASIIIVALKGMFKQLFGLKALWDISVIDFAIWVVTFLATVLMDVDLGLLIGVIFALSTVIYQSQRPYSCILGQAPGTDLYRDVAIYTAAIQIQGIKIFRFDSPLYFANAEHFKYSIYKLAVNPKLVKKKMRKQQNLAKKLEKNMELNGRKQNGNQTDIQMSVNETDDEDMTSVTGAVGNDISTVNDVHSIIIDCSSIIYTDSVGVKALQQVVQEYNSINVQVYLAQCKSRVRDMLEKTGFYKKLEDKEGTFVSIHDAVLSVLKYHRRRNMEIPDQDTQEIMDNRPSIIPEQDSVSTMQQELTGNRTNSIVGAPLVDNTDL